MSTTFASELPSLQCVPMARERHSAEQVAALIYASAPDLFDLLWGRSAVGCLTKLVTRSHNRFSYRYVRVAEIDGQVLGAVLQVPAPALNDNSDYPIALGTWKHLRLRLAYALLLDRILKHDFPPNSLYIANLAVASPHRGQGIGTRLLQQCIAAAAAQASPLYISVSIDNPRAQKLYESLGFEVVDVQTLRLLQTTIGTRVLHLPIAPDPLA